MSFDFTCNNITPEKANQNKDTVFVSEDNEQNFLIASKPEWLTVGPREFSTFPKETQEKMGNRRRIYVKDVKRTPKGFPPGENLKYYVLEYNIIVLAVPEKGFYWIPLDKL